MDREPIWVPEQDEITAANVSRFARRLTQHGRVRLTGGDPRQVMDAGAVDDPGALQWFAAYQTRTPIP